MSLPEPASPRYRSLDVWRGIACLMVVLDHVAIPLINSSDVDQGGSATERLLRMLVFQASRLALGPPLFFVISGYCIAASVDSVRSKGKSPLVFLKRRLWRTYPPYWAAVLIFAGVTAGLDAAGRSWLHDGPHAYPLTSPAALTTSQWVGNLTLTETWRPRVWGDPTEVYTRVAWSLCYQEQFYVLCFLVVLIAPRRLFGVLAGATALIAFWRFLYWDIGQVETFNGMFPYFWHEFAIGLGAYWRLNLARNRTERHTIDALLLALIAIASLTDFESTTAAAGFGLVMIGLRPCDGWLAEVRGLSWLRACGRRCYSIYLIHLPVASIGTRVLCEQMGLTGFWTRAGLVLPLMVAASVAAGWVFFRLIESRFATLPTAKTPELGAVCSPARARIRAAA